MCCRLRVSPIILSYNTRSHFRGTRQWHMIEHSRLLTETPIPPATLQDEDPGCSLKIRVLVLGLLGKPPQYSHKTTQRRLYFAFDGGRADQRDG